MDFSDATIAGAVATIKDRAQKLIIYADMAVGQKMADADFVTAVTDASTDIAAAVVDVTPPPEP